MFGTRGSGAHNVYMLVVHKHVIGTFDKGPEVRCACTEGN